MVMVTLPGLFLQVQAVFSNIEALLEFTQGMQKVLTAKMEDRTSVYSAIGGYFLSMVLSPQPHFQRAAKAQRAW
jgi:hypothetical protein